MAELLGMSNAAWKRQPSGVIQPHEKYNYPGSIFFNASAPAGYGFTYEEVGTINKTADSAGIGVSSGTTSSRITTTRPKQAIIGQHTVVVACRALDAVKRYVSGTVDNNVSYIEDILINSSSEATSAGRIEILFRSHSSNVQLRGASDVIFSTGDLLYFAFKLDSSTQISLAFHGKAQNVNYSVTGPYAYIDAFAEYPLVLLNRNVRGAFSNGTGVTLYAYARIPAALDIESLSANPWQLFAPAPSRFYLIPSSGAISLIVASATHAHTADALSLTQAHILALADSLHSQSAESPILSQAYALTLAAAAHAQNADNAALTQANILAAQDALQSQSADSPTLIQAYILTLADATHSQAADGVTLSVAGVLLVADGQHTHTADGLTLTQAHILSAADGQHTQTAENIPLGQGYSLVVADGQHSQAADAPTLAVAFVLSVLEAIHSQTADALTLSTHITLVVSDALHTQLASAAVEATLTPAGRVFLVQAEDRVFVVMREDRVFSIVSEDRTFGV